MTAYHRYGNDYVAGAESDRRRVRQALGAEPVEDARHLLPPLVIPAGPPPPPAGPHPGTEFVVDLQSRTPVMGERALLVVTPGERARFDFPRFWGRPAGRECWVPVDRTDPATRYETFALCWDLTALLSDGADAARDLGAYAEAAARFATDLGGAASPRETPEDAARRAAHLLGLRERFGRSVEMRLMPAGRPFPARDIWRAAYALGLEWGAMDLFHWREPVSGRPLFTVSAVGQPGYFLPERAAEGEGILGVALGFELPYSPAPVQVYDRMAVALAFFRQKLGGRPMTSDGYELDADRLYEDREVLEEMIADMARAGIAPGTSEAVRFF